MFTAQSVIDRARLVWKEKTADDILSNPNCLLWMSDAIIEMRSIRPEAQVDDNGNLIDYADVTDASTVLQYDVKYRPVLVDYLIARGFMGDSDSQNHEERANAHFKLFYDRIKVV